MRKSSLAAALAAGALAFAVAACGSDDTPSTSGGGGDATATQAAKAKVGVILPDAASSARWETADRKFLGEAFKAAGVESDIQNANGDKAKFATIADQMLNSGANVLVIINLDSPSAAAVIKKAKQQASRSSTTTVSRSAAARSTTCPSTTSRSAPRSARAS